MCDKGRCDPEFCVLIHVPSPEGLAEQIEWKSIGQLNLETTRFILDRKYQPITQKAAAAAAGKRNIKRLKNSWKRRAKKEKSRAMPFKSVHYETSMGFRGIWV